MPVVPLPAALPTPAATTVLRSVRLRVLPRRALLPQLAPRAVVLPRPVAMAVLRTVLLRVPQRPAALRRRLVQTVPLRVAMPVAKMVVPPLAVAATRTVAATTVAVRITVAISLT